MRYFTRKLESVPNIPWAIVDQPRIPQALAVSLPDFAWPSRALLCNHSLTHFFQMARNHSNGYITMPNNIPAMLFIAGRDHFKFLSVISSRHVSRAFLKSLNSSLFDQSVFYIQSIVFNRMFFISLNNFDKKVR